MSYEIMFIYFAFGEPDTTIYLFKVTFTLQIYWNAELLFAFQVMKCV